MAADKEKQLKALREILDGVYLDASQSHAGGTVPCDLTIIFTALASLTVNYDNMDEKYDNLNDKMEKLAGGCFDLKQKLDEIDTNIKVNDAREKGKKTVWVGLISFISGGLGLLILKWLAENMAGGI
jgi:hypothetical protein